MSLNFSGRGKVALLVWAGCMIWVFSSAVSPNTVVAFTEAPVTNWDCVMAMVKPAKAEKQ